MLAFPQTPAHSRTRLLPPRVSAHWARTRPRNGLFPSLALPSLARAGVQLTRRAYSVQPSFWEDQFSAPFAVARYHICVT